MPTIKESLQSVSIKDLKFIPFLPTDNFKDESPSAQDHVSVKKNIDNLKVLFKENFLVFLSHMINNTSLQGLIETYTSFRIKPFQTIDIDCNQDILTLDRQMFLLIFRLDIKSEEKDKIEEFLPKPALEVVNLKVSSTSGRESSKKIQNELKSIMNLIPCLKIPIIMDLLSIVGESNLSLTNPLIEGLFEYKVSIRKELVDSVIESSEAISQLAQTSVALHQFLFAQQNLKSATAALGLKSKGDSLEQLHFIVSFMADIVYTWACFLRSSESILASTDLFCNYGILPTNKYGTTLVNSLRLIYELVLPLSIKAHRHFSLEKNPANEEKTQSDIYIIPSGDNNGKNGLSIEEKTSILEEIQHLLRVSQSKTLQSLYSLIKVSTLAITNETTDHGLTGLIDNRLTGSSWVEVLQQPLNFQLALFGSSSSEGNKHILAVCTSLEPMLRPGSFASDYLSVYGENDLETLIELALIDPTAMDSVKTEGRKGGKKSKKTGKERSSEEFGTDFVLSSLRVGETLLPPRKKNSTFEGKRGDLEITKVEFFEMSKDEKVQQVKAIFPDLGKAFVLACLEIYEQNTEQVIDALLTENLHPKLLLLDRSTEEIWLGKNKENKDESYKAVKDMNEEYAQQEKERMRHLERQRLNDWRLVEYEYNDDYDDQYDDVAYSKWEDPTADNKAETIFNWKKNDNKQTTKYDKIDKETADLARKMTESLFLGLDEDSMEDGDFNDDLAIKPNFDLKVENDDVSVSTTSTSASKKKTKKQLEMERKAVDWDKRMSDMKRVNAVLRGEEAEEKFWELMKNTNHNTGKKSSKFSKTILKNDEIDTAPETEKTEKPKTITNQKDDKSSSDVKATEKESIKDNENNKTNKKDNNEKKKDQKKKSTKKEDYHGPTSGGTAKFRTFDKHRQKDRASKKLAKATML